MEQRNSFLIETTLVAALFSLCNPLLAQNLEEGKAVYNRICLECHGPAGRGDGVKAKKMGFRPRDFTLGSFKCRCTPSGELPTDEDLLRSLRQGLPGSPMQSLGTNASEQEHRSVVQYIKTLSPRFAREIAPPCIFVPEPIALTPETVAEGREVYRVLSCWTCHGKGGRGDGPAAKDLKDNWDNPIKPYNFVLLKKFKCGGSDQDLYRTLHTGLNGSPMPSYTEAFAFPKEGIEDFSPYREMFGDEETRQLVTFMEQQPDAAAIGAMSADERQKLIEKRTWALVHYLRSLLRR